jgi:signal transduction histidine kinase
LSPNKKISAKRVRQYLDELSWNPSLPIAIFHHTTSRLIFANPRMLSILGLSEAISENSNNVLSLEKLWPFSNDELGPPAVLRELLHKNSEIVAQAQLKNYKLRSHCFKEDNCVIVAAELVRRGDLLQDKNSRQLLFRLISHEVRTAVQSLRGYASMMDESNKLLKERMSAGIERLDKVVSLLDDLKTELEIDDEDKNESAS